MRLFFSVLITLLSLFYFLPVAIAFNKKRANTGAIFALNLFLGWSLIGWVVALVWALKEEEVL
jgi:ABC-type sugar transport system permease subunit